MSSCIHLVIFVDAGAALEPSGKTLYLAPFGGKGRHAAGADGHGQPFAADGFHVHTAARGQARIKVVDADPNIDQPGSHRLLHFFDVDFDGLDVDALTVQLLRCWLHGRDRSRTENSHGHSCVGGGSAHGSGGLAFGGDDRSGAGQQRPPGFREDNGPPAR